MIPMKPTPLSQLALVSAGQGAPKDNEFSESGVPFVRAGSLEPLLSGKKESELELVSPETAKLRKLKTYPKGTILFAKSGMSATKDRVYVLQNPAHVVSHLATLIPKDGAHVDYLRLALKRFPPSSLIKDPAYPAIGLGEIENFEIPVPEEFDDQIRIAHLLGKVEGLIAQRKQHLQQLDDLLKSIFLDMFGDQLASGPKTTLGTYITTLSDYHANGSYETLKEHVQLSTEPGYALMVRTTDLENKNFSEGCNYITKEAYEFLEKSKVYGGEIIVNKIGSAGKVYLMPSLGRPVSLGMNAFLLRFNEGLNNIFAYHFLISDVGTQRIQKLVKGAVTKTITKDAIRSIAIPVVPPDYQGKFADAAAKVESIKTSYQQSLSELEALYCALSQQAFKGELDLSRVPLPADQTKPADPLPEDIVTPTEVLNRVVQFASPESRSELLASWFNRYLTNTAPDVSLGSRGFLEAAWQPLQETRLESEGESPALTLADYDALKDLIFAALEDGTLVQTFAEESNRVSLQRRAADWGSF